MYNECRKYYFKKGVNYEKNYLLDWANCSHLVLVETDFLIHRPLCVINKLPGAIAPGSFV